MPNICKICKESVKSDRHFYQKHKISAADYYVKYYNRKDLFSGDPIIFHNKIQYFSTFFNSSKNMKKWVSKVNKEIFVKFFTVLIDHRNKIKHLKKPLGEAELMSLDNFPTMDTILKKISMDEYLEIYKNFGVVGKPFSDYSLRPIEVKDLTIGVDTREQYPFKFEKSRPFKLDYGDYTVIGEGFENVFIDRKSGPDFVSTFGGNVKRFKNEIERASAFAGYLVVLVEVNMYLLKTGKGRLFSYTRCSPEMIFHNVREIMQEYNNVQFLFTKSRVEARRCLPTILSYGMKVKDVDLQYLYNGGKL